MSTPKISFNATPDGSAQQAEAMPEKPRAHMKASPADKVRTAISLQTKPDALSFPASRKLIVLGGAVLCVLVFLLGVTTTLLLGGNNRQAFTASTSQQPRLGAMRTAQPSNADVTRAASSDLTHLAAPAPTNAAVSDLAAAVIEGLQPNRAVATATEGELAHQAATAAMLIDEGSLQALRESVRAGAYTIDTVEQNGVMRVRFRTLDAEATDDVVGSILMQAAAEGRIELPQSLKTPDGTADTDTMMFNLVQTSLANDGTLEGAEAAREMSRRMFAASPARSKEVGGKRIYTVEAGDSLAYIALQFYGKPSAFQRILEANRETLQSPDKIQVGQRLIIPS